MPTLAVTSRLPFKKRDEAHYYRLKVEGKLLWPSMRLRRFEVSSLRDEHEEHTEPLEERRR